MDALISESITDCSDFYQSLLEVVLPLWKMMVSTNSTFKNSSKVNFEEESTPVHLLTIVSMLLDGPGVTNPHLLLRNLHKQIFVRTET